MVAGDSKSSKEKPLKLNFRVPTAARSRWCDATRQCLASRLPRGIFLLKVDVLALASVLEISVLVLVLQSCHKTETKAWTFKARC